MTIAELKAVLNHVPDKAEVFVDKLDPDSGEKPIKAVNVVYTVEGKLVILIP